ncbi:MAG: gamma-glutamyltransferase [Oscillatoriales cyanobacterium RM1_1_9]|nr:gamma-glutamyltransferase [Oscillatoriales cyanobacterium RM1_1_9]
MSFVSIAASSQIAAEAGATVANQGGNAVDAAIAATLVALCTDTGIVAPGGGGFIAIWPLGNTPVVIDAYGEMPGRGLGDQQAISRRFQTSTRRVGMGYGGGMETIVAHGSVATPGIFAGLSQAIAQYGSLPWSGVMQPAVDWAKRGSALSAAGAEYLRYSHEVIFGWHPDSYPVVHHRDGRCLTQGETIYIPELAATLQQIADAGVATFYSGTLAERMTEEIQAHGGLLTLEDLQAYRAVVRTPIQVRYRDWDIVTNPAPAIGGACLGAMLLLLDRPALQSWTTQTVDQWIQIQSAVLGYRHQHLDPDHDNAQAVDQLLKQASKGDLQSLSTLNQSPSTIHISAVDRDGLACSISASAGYGSGVMVSGTGLWLNNSLGEIELHPQGLDHCSPGTRLVSNMAPTIARHPSGAVLAIGSPGASRITTAIAQVLFNHLQLGMALPEAIAAPRLHVEVSAGTQTTAMEPGLPLSPKARTQIRQFSERSMYFGGVQAVMWEPNSGFVARADPRRTGGVAEGGQ